MINSRVLLNFGIILVIYFALGLQMCFASKDANSVNLIRIVSTLPYQIGTMWYQPILSTVDFQDRGIASWYGGKFQGKRTSNGEFYDMYAMTAAHKILPLDSWVRVKNLRNNKSVVVRINDRGPFIKDRIIDLSYAAANEINMINEGTTEVELEHLGEKKITERGVEYVQPEYRSAPLIIQIGAFKSLKNAEKIKQKFSGNCDEIKIIPFQSEEATFYRVCINNFPTLEAALEYKKFLIDEGITEILILSEYS